MGKLNGVFVLDDEKLKKLNLYVRKLARKAENKGWLPGAEPTLKNERGGPEWWDIDLVIGEVIFHRKLRAMQEKHKSKVIKKVKGRI